MPLSHTISRALSLGKSRERSGTSATRPALGRPQATASSLQRSIHKSTFLYGRPPAKTRAGLTPEQVLDFTYMLSQPVGTPLLTSNIANLGRPLSRPAGSNAASCLCDVHSWFELRWIEELTAIVGEEIGPRLDNLCEAPRQLRSLDTEETIGRLSSYAHMFPTAYPDSSRTKYPQCNTQSCDFCSVISCKACKLSQIFQDAEAVKALNVCAKGRKKRSTPWPESCAWLDPIPGCGWEMKWKIEGLPILSDRIIVRKWMKMGGRERLTEAMASMQSEVLANKEAVRQSVKSELGTPSVLNEILERDWSVYGNPLASSETVNLIMKMELDDDDNGKVHVEAQTDSERWGKAYSSLIGEPFQNLRVPLPHEKHGVQADRTSRVGSLQPSAVASTSTVSRTRSRTDSFASSKTTLTSIPPSSSNNDNSHGVRGSRAVSRTSKPDSHQGERADRSSRTSRADSWAPSSTAASKATLKHSTSGANSRTSRADTWASSSTAASDTTSTARSSGIHDKTYSKLPHGGYEYDQRPVAMSPTQSIYSDGGQDQLGAQSTLTVDSWANFNSSPLGRGRVNQSKQSVNDLKGGKRLQSWQTSHTNYAASVNQT